MSSTSSIVNVDRLATIVSGEMYPEWGILERERRTRLVVDRSSFPNPGNGMPVRENIRKLGAYPPKNESESTGALSSFDERVRSVSAGNDFIASGLFNNEFGAP